MSITLTDALRLLPHGPEFRFVDRLLTLEPGKQATGEYLVRGDEVFLHGHFPNNPMMPGVLLIEACAQLAGVVAQTDPVIPVLPGLKLTAVRAVKITGTARPGGLLRLEAHVVGRLGNLVHAQATAFLDNVLLLSGEFTLSGDHEPESEKRSKQDDRTGREEGNALRSALAPQESDVPRPISR